MTFIVKKVLIFCVLLVAFFAFSGNTYATSEKSNPLPISFQIDVQNWNDVNKTLPKYSKFTVIDVESGKSFDVQRRAGNRHADVQPLTKKDTKIMKQIYDGSWSWRRKAVLILTQDRLIPASMHGMPHGAGALKNDFPGHFCIHFSGSTTHRTGKSDLSHHVMILKAAGKIDEYINTLPPSQLLNVFFVSIKNDDKGLAKKMAISNQKNLKKELVKIDNIEAIQWSLPPINENKTTELSTTIPVDVSIFIKDAGPIRTKLTFTLIRTSFLSPWKVNMDPLLSTLSNS
jgi:hypothetical protein